MEGYGTISNKPSSIAMASQGALFKRPCLESMDRVLTLIMFPQTTFVNILLSSLKLTTKERESRESEDPCYERYVLLSILIPTLCILIILYLPIYSIAFLIWAPLQSHRRLYRLWVNHQATAVGSSRNQLTVISVDTRLLPECDARWDENLGHTQRRATEMTKRLISDDSLIIREKSQEEASTTESSIHSGKQKEGGNTGQKQELPDEEHSSIGGRTIFSVSEFFPVDADVVCLQGVIDQRSEKKLVTRLRQFYPYVISDVTKNAWKTNRFRYGSGLVMASRFPVSEVEFQCFRDSTGKDKHRAKGYLLAVLVLGVDTAGRDQLLTVINTEMQQGYGPAAVDVRCHQMSQMVEIFKDRHEGKHDVIPEIVCCNLHFDNFSLDEKSNWSHPWFDGYIDPCASCPGPDVPDVTGTEVRRDKVHDRSISSPESMKRTLSTAKGQHEFLEQVHNSSLGGATSCTSSRRTNRILQKQGAHNEMHVREFVGVTQLAGLTSYLPIAAKLHLHGTSNQ